MSIRLRLSFWHSSVLGGVLFLFCLTIYGFVSYSLRAQLDSSLENTAAEILKSVQIDRNQVDFQINPFNTSNLAQLIDTHGAIYKQSPVLESMGLTTALDEASLGSTSTWSTLEARRLRVYTLPIFVNQTKLIGHLQVVASLKSVDAALTALLIVLIMGGLGAVMLMVIIGMGSADQVLQPLEAITQTAREITRADDLSRRIPIDPEANVDEMGRFVVTFNESLDRLEKLFNAQRRFLADVSHELRTPLTAIRGNVDLLRRMGGADAESLDAIQSEAERMTRLVGDLLMLAQADAGNLPLVKKPVELDTLLLELFREAQVLAGGNVTIAIGEIDQVIVNGDRDRLKQLLLNLVTNALKFTPPGGRLTLALARITDRARITVTDTGLGIPPAEQARIFERFYRVDKARSRALGGAGLGLSIGQHIAHMHGGRIEVNSEGIPGRGTTFSVWLPLDPVVVQPSDTEKTRPRLPVITLPKLRN